MDNIVKKIMEEYNIIEVSENYYRTSGGRAYIRKDGKDYTIFSCNGSRKGSESSFRLACIRATIV